jgi:hypothetical protein
MLLILGINFSSNFVFCIKSEIDNPDFCKANWKFLCRVCSALNNFISTSIESSTSPSNKSNSTSFNVIFKSQDFKAS